MALTPDHRPLVVALPDADDEALLRFAAWEALLHGCSLQLVHASRSGDCPALHALLESAIARTEVLTGPGVPVTATAVTGGPVAGVLAHSADARAVVVRQRDALHLMRSISEDPRPGRGPAVALVPSTWRVVPDDDRPVLVGIDDPDASRALVISALRIARDHGTSLRAFHAWCFPQRYDAVIDARIGEQWSRTEWATLSHAVTRYRAEEHSDVAVDVVVEHGVAADLLVAAAGQAQALVLQRNHPGQGPEHVGRTTRTALHACPCPVILLPSSRR